VSLTPIDSAFVADLREVAASGEFGRVTRLTPSGLTIAAVVEIACLRSAFPTELRQTIETWQQDSPALSRASVVYETGSFPDHEAMWQGRSLDFFPIRGPGWADAVQYHPFESRFCNAARQAGFGRKADALTGALFEMADNVAQHSGDEPSSPAPGLIGYHVSEGNVSFAIADLGRGVLNSLRANPVWADLRNSKSALMAVVEKHASRRVHGGEGEGFKEVFRSLMNLNGIVELRSGEGRVRLVCAPDGSRQAQPQFTGPFSGLQVAVSCSLTAPAKEVIFSVDYLT
jgi:anti-sigma regulatory factor (Ser/Thr protein kinase)